MSKALIAWLERNKGGIIKDARLRGRMFRFGGRYQYGSSVPVGTGVLYLEKLMLATVESPAGLPEEGAEGWALMIDLAHMRVADAFWVNGPAPMPPLDKSGITAAVSSRLAQHYTMRLAAEAVLKPSPGVHKWAGLFHTSKSYSTGDIVAFNRGIFMCGSGAGVPGYNQEGWSYLDGIQGLGVNEGLLSVVVNNDAKDILILTFAGEITASDPMGGWFVNGIGGFNPAILDAVISGNTLTLTLTDVFVCSDKATVSYYADGMDFAVNGVPFEDLMDFPVHNGIHTPVPGITTHPQDVSVDEPDPGTFTIVGTDVTGYQWQRDGHDMAGAIAASYTTGATRHQNSHKYSCRLSNDCGSILSNEANLFVNYVDPPMILSADSESITTDNTHITADSR